MHRFSIFISIVYDTQYLLTLISLFCFWSSLHKCSNFSRDKFCLAISHSKISFSFFFNSISFSWRLANNCRTLKSAYNSVYFSQMILNFSSELWLSLKSVETAFPWMCSLISIPDILVPPLWLPLCKIYWNK